jgi:hypothetical protein
MEGLIIGSFFIGMCGFVVYKTIKENQRIRDMSNWSVGVGYILENIQKWEDDGEYLCFMQIVRYGYKIDGIEYHSVLKFDINSSLGLKNRFFAKLKIGDKVDMIYNPKQKHESELKRFNHNLQNEPLGLAVVFLLLGILAILCSFWY